MAKKAKNYAVVRFKSKSSSYCRIKKLSKICFDKIKSKVINMYDPMVRQHVQFTVHKAK